MKTLNLILPGLLWKDVGDIEYLYSNINIKNLDKLIKSSQIKSYNFTYSDLIYQLMYKNVTMTLAKYLANQICAEYMHEYTFLIAEPTHLRADRDRLLISESELLQLTEDEAKDIISAINSHFANELKIFYVAEHIWLIGVKFNLDENNFYPILDIIDENIDDYLPKGANQILFSKILNEIQMLLFNLPLNQERKHGGLLTINSIWMWDKNLCNTHKDIIDLLAKNLVSNNVQLIKLKNNKYRSFTGTVTDYLFEDVTIFVDSLYFPCCYRDSNSWMNTIENLDQQIAHVIKSEMDLGKINTLRIIVPTQYKTIEIILTKLSRFKFWKNNTFLKIIKDYQ